MTNRNVRITYFLNGLSVQQITGESTPQDMLKCVNLSEAFFTDSEGDARAFDTIECHTATKIGWQRNWVLNVNS